MNAKISLATFLLSSTIAVGFSACDKGSAPAAPPDATPATPATPEGDESAAAEDDAVEPGAPNVKWADKTFKQRKEYMGIVFLKEMKTSFKAHDEASFSGFKCQTCHGDDMKERNFEMPSDSLMPLNADNPVEAAMEFDEEITTFMVEKVVPQSAELLDMEPYNPETGKGFGCFGCHPTE